MAAATVSPARSQTTIDFTQQGYPTDNPTNMVNNSITQITLTFSSNSPGSNSISVNTGTFSSPTWTGSATEVTFTAATSATWPEGANGIPSGWTRVNQ